jgi:hypothetical protein
MPEMLQSADVSYPALMQVSSKCNARLCRTWLYLQEEVEMQVPGHTFYSQQLTIILKNLEEKLLGA